MSATLPTATPATATAPSAASRIASIDIIRGAVMVLMAIDHVRVYSGLPAGGPTPGVFFTRWVTHFCAPAFVFLAGTAAFLHGRKLEQRGALSRFLLVRGAWLVFLEMTVIRLGWTFNLDFSHYLLAGVIWVIGWSMIVLAGLVRFQTKTIAAFGLIVVFLQNIVGALGGALPQSVQNATGWLWQVLYFGGEVPLGSGGPPLVVLYVLVPWVGVMAAGYAFGAVMVRADEDRRRLCLRIGLAATALFMVAAGLLVLLRPAPEGAPPALFRFLGQQKYPASQLFLLMTLGPTIALIPLLESARGKLAQWLTVFGRVPMFYYLLHIPLIHALALVVSQVRLGVVSPWLFENHPMRNGPAPDGYTWSLPLLYLVWAIAVVLLYAACRPFAALKARSKSAWLSYL